MSKRKNISKQDLKNIDLVLENDVQCSGLNIGGRAYEFVSGGYEILELTGASGTLTNAQLLDLIVNDSILIEIAGIYYQKGTNTNDYLLYYGINFDGENTRTLGNIVINKNNGSWNYKSQILQNKSLTITDVNPNVTATITKASIINGVLYITFRGVTTDALTGTFTLCKVNGLPTISDNIGFVFKKSSTLTSFGFLRVVNGNIEIETSYVSGQNVEFALAILL